MTEREFPNVLLRDPFFINGHMLYITEILGFNAKFPLIQKCSCLCLERDLRHLLCLFNLTPYESVKLVVIFCLLIFIVILLEYFQFQTLH